jgi:hypothetical protein
VFLSQSQRKFVHQQSARLAVVSFIFSLNDSKKIDHPHSAKACKYIMKNNKKPLQFSKEKVNF